MTAESSESSLQVEVSVKASLSDAFAAFVRRLGHWWPPEYTWSQEVLVDIGMEPKIGGACYELGPHGFRCDWGHIVSYSEPDSLRFRWQISPRREPVPDPKKASEVEIGFHESMGTTRVVVVHRGFDNHGNDAGWYRDALASEMGWPRILEAYRLFLEGRSTE